MGTEKDLVDILSAWLTPIVAIIGVIIASVQVWLAFKKRKDDLFERRYDFYQKLENMWLATRDYENPSYPDVEDLIPWASRAEFLFGGDIADHILTLEEKHHNGSPYFPDDDFVKPFKKYLVLK